MLSDPAKNQQMSEQNPEHTMGVESADHNPTLRVASQDQSDQIMRDDTQHRDRIDAPPSYNSEKPDITLVTAQPRATDEMISQPVEPAKESGMQHRVLRRMEDLGEVPEYIDCPHCKTRQQTKVSHPSSSATTFSALFCCLCCGVITVCIPFLCNWFAETDHHCGNCGKLVAHKPHDGTMEARLPLPAPRDKYGESQFKPMSPEERQNIEEANTTSWRATATSETPRADVEKPKAAVISG